MKQYSDAAFAVIYRWQLTPGLENEFVEGWTSVARSLEENFGSLGARLHRAEDATWVAYSQWPDRETWENAQLASRGDLDAMRRMQNAIERRYQSIRMEFVAGSPLLRQRKPEPA